MRISAPQASSYEDADGDWHARQNHILGIDDDEDDDEDKDEEEEEAGRGGRGARLACHAPETTEMLPRGVCSGTCSV